MNKAVLNKVLMVFCVMAIFSCDQNQKSERNQDFQQDSFIGTKLNWMKHAVKPHNFDSEDQLPDYTKQYKIVTYGDLYCYPCWESLFPWKEELAHFEKFDNVSFFCVINALEEDFDKENQKVNFEFPVFLDLQKRFRTVNKIGSDPSRMTFLLDENDEIVLVGQPFSKKMRDEYTRIISASSSK